MKPPILVLPLLLIATTPQAEEEDPDFIGVDFCACLFDQSHPDQAYERGQRGSDA
jgi:hypothetical protein